MRMQPLTTYLVLLLSLWVSPATGFSVSKNAATREARGIDGGWIQKTALPIIAASSKHQVRTETTLSVSFNSDQDNESPSLTVNPWFASAWVGLVAWAFAFAPGSVGSPQDTALLQAVIDNPVSPGINELYYTFFNFFATIPVILAAIALSQGQRKGLPAAPFLVMSAAFGYFAAGPYLALRAEPRTTLEGETVGGFTRNVLENKAFSWFILAFTLYLPVAAQVFPAYQQDPTALWNGFVELVTTSRFAAVSLMDIFILYISTVALTPRDYLLRNPEATDEEARNVALATAVLPIVGSALYCAVRPALALDEEQ